MPPKTRKKMVFWSQYDKLIGANLPARENSFKKSFICYPIARWCWAAEKPLIILRLIFHSARGRERNGELEKFSAIRIQNEIQINGFEWDEIERKIEIHASCQFLQQIRFLWRRAWYMRNECRGMMLACLYCCSYSPSYYKFS